MSVKTLLEAIKAREAVIDQFNILCEEGRISPVPLGAFTLNRQAYMLACEDVYTSMFYNVADTGVQLLKNTGKVAEVVIDPNKPKT